MTVLVVVEAEELRRLIKEAVADALPSGDARDQWVDAHSSGLGRRTFLRLAREGAFPVSKIGKRYVARQADLAAYLDTQRIRERANVRATLTPPSRGRHEQRVRTAIEAGLSKAEVDDPVARALAEGRLRVLKRSP
jgi:hypothetical protein